jgi:hypothetical protein
MFVNEGLIGHYIRLGEYTKYKLAIDVLWVSISERAKLMFEPNAHSSVKVNSLKRI